MQALLKQMLSHMVQHGDLTVAMPDGSETRFGDATGTPTGFRIHDSATVRHLLIDPDLYLGEAYTSGQLSVTDGNIYDVLKLLMANLETARTPVPVRIPYAIRKRLKRLQQDNRIGRARSNVAHHYDLSGDLYDLFLDNDRQYSCAYFEKTGQSLEQAQLAKKRHLAAKLVIEPGMKVLDIGSGWGRTWALPRTGLRGAGHRCHPVARATQGIQPACAGSGAGRPGQFSPQGLPGTERQVRPDRFGGHVRACRRQTLW